MAWCEHCTKEIRPDHWNFCPICGVPRPEEKKKLWQIIEGDPNNTSYVRLSEDSAKHITNNFLKWMEEIISTTEGGIEAMERAWVDKWKIIERIDSEKS